MKAPLTVVLSAMLALGCASGSGGERAHDFAGWSDEPRTIGVAGAAQLPDAILLTDEQHLARDTLAGAGSGALAGTGWSLYIGCYIATEWGLVAAGGPVGLLALFPCGLGIVAIPYAAAIGSVVGGASGAAASEPVETPYPLEEVIREASALLQRTLDRHDAGSMLMAALMDAIDERTTHEAYRDPLAAKLAAQKSFEELRDTLDDEGIDGLLVVRLTAIGFRHHGVLDTEESDPELAFTMGATASVYFPEGGCLKEAVFLISPYEGKEHRLSGFQADDGILAYRELRNVADIVAGILVSRMFVSGNADQEKLVPGVGPVPLALARRPPIARPRMTAERC